MIVLTACGVGLLSVCLRSVAAYILCGLMIVGVFALAMLVSSGPTSWILLAEAMLGYNAGIVSAVGAAYALSYVRHA